MTIRRTLLTAAIATSSAVSVHAQQQPTETTQTETVVVTGSRIPRIDAETPSPVQVVSREAIEQAGRQSISEVLRGLVSADNQGSIPTAFSGGFAAGSSAVSLRGLGVNSTLVLLNGRRMSTYGLADDGVRTFVDLNSIPLEAVERVEVLKDGGSALYGSDAVAGVVNIICTPTAATTTTRLTTRPARWGVSIRSASATDSDLPRCEGPRRHPAPRLVTGVLELNGGAAPAALPKPCCTEG